MYRVSMHGVSPSISSSVTTMLFCYVSQASTASPENLEQRADRLVAASAQAADKSRKKHPPVLRSSILDINLEWGVTYDADSTGTREKDDRESVSQPRTRAMSLDAYSSGADRGDRDRDQSEEEEEDGCIERTTRRTFSVSCRGETQTQGQGFVHSPLASSLPSVCELKAYEGSGYASDAALGAAGEMLASPPSREMSGSFRGRHSHSILSRQCSHELEIGLPSPKEGASVAGDSPREDSSDSPRERTRTASFAAIDTGESRRSSLVPEGGGCGASEGRRVPGPCRHCHC
jgi:hypothetical protein